MFLYLFINYVHPYIVLFPYFQCYRYHKITEMAKKKPTSWQRRKAKESAGSDGAGVSGQPTKSKKPPSAAGAQEAALNLGAARAKAASALARERYRTHTAAEPGDEALIAAYSEAKSAMRSFHETKPQTCHERKPHKSHKSHEMDGEKQTNKTRIGEDREGRSAETEGSDEGARGNADLESRAPLKRAKVGAHGGANQGNVYTKEALGVVSREERRRAKKERRKLERAGVKRPLDTSRVSRRNTSKDKYK